MASEDTPAPPCTVTAEASRNRVPVLAGARIAAGGASWSLGAGEDSAATACLDAALDAGVRVLDTGGAYTRHGLEHHNEQIIGAGLARRYGPPALLQAEAEAAKDPSGRPQNGRPLVVTKCGHHRTGATSWDIDARPEVLRRDVQGSLRALGTERLDVCLLHWPDPAVPLADSVGALTEMQRGGLIAHVGVSNIDARQLRGLLAATVDAGPDGDAMRAAPVVEVVQTRLSVLEPVSADLAELLSLCQREGIAVMGYAPFGGPGRLRTALGQRPEGSHLLREAGSQTRQLLISQLAEQWGLSVHHLLLRWLLATYPHVTAVVGSTQPTSIWDAAAAAGASPTSQPRQPALSPSEHLELSVAVTELQQHVGLS